MELVISTDQHNYGMSFTNKIRKTTAVPITVKCIVFEQLLLHLINHHPFSINFISTASFLFSLSRVIKNCIKKHGIKRA